MKEPHHRARSRFSTLVGQWWFGDAFVIAMSVLVLVLSAVMSTDPQVARLFGWEIPTLCGFRLMTGMDCPGCGLTRSFIFLGHGSLEQAWNMNMLGPPLYLAVLLQIPMRLYRMATRPRPTS